MALKAGCLGQGLANILAGLFGGMGGCAMIGQTMINVKSGGVNRLSSASEVAYTVAELFIVWAGEWFAAAQLVLVRAWRAVPWC